MFGDIWTAKNCVKGKLNVPSGHTSQGDVILKIMMFSLSNTIQQYREKRPAAVQVIKRDVMCVLLK